MRENWRKLQNQELHTTNSSSPDIIRWTQINEDVMGRTCGRSGKRKNTYRVGVEKVNYRDRFEGLLIYIGG